MAGPAPNRVLASRKPWAGIAQRSNFGVGGLFRLGRENDLIVVGRQREIFFWRRVSAILNRFWRSGGTKNGDFFLFFCLGQQKKKFLPWNRARRRWPMAQREGENGEAAHAYYKWLANKRMTATARAEGHRATAPHATGHRRPNARLHSRQPRAHGLIGIDVAIVSIEAALEHRRDLRLGL